MRLAEGFVLGRGEVMNSVLDKNWIATHGTATNVLAVWDEDGNQLAIITDTQQPDAVSQTMAAATRLVTACQIVYDWLQNDSIATSDQVFAEVRIALQYARPWDDRIRGDGPAWG